MSIEKWLAKKIPYLQGLKQRSEDQETLLRLALKGDRTDREERALQAAIRVERSADRYHKARVESRKVRSQTKSAERKARTHELIESAGLLIMAGLVDSRTGKPIDDVELLLGGLLALRRHLDGLTEEQRAGHKIEGRDRLLQESQKKAPKPSSASTAATDAPQSHDHTTAEAGGSSSTSDGGSSE